MTEEKVLELKERTLKFRNDLVDILHHIQTGHPGGSLSAAEIITTLYFDKLNIDPENPKAEGRDRFILSKGHACPMLYINMAERGFFPKEDLMTLRQTDSHLQGHPCAHKTPGVELSAGPLGLGLGAGLGMALGERMKKSDAYTYVLLGDGEVQEGGIWEAAMAASKYKTNRLIAILDNNGVQLDGTLEEIMTIGDIGSKFESFGWNVIRCDGHDIASFSNAVDEAKMSEERPSIIIAETVKGKGVSFMEGKNIWHGKPIGPEEYKKAKMELGGQN
ncbi:transketolase [Proteiniclasticum sp. SCR006]|uniref:Transketolase n=1 Tax=Proteiniclasticum aestuarii TaxID=2817862 RepID=A0A939H9R1_9CLOT|nr:transketolase [Proteiniclasticum aestuarii]MBO1264310.1 transketolase [Proteiniclasticum aestuarii]